LAIEAKKGEVFDQKMQRLAPLFLGKISISASKIYYFYILSRCGKPRLDAGAPATSASYSQPWPPLGLPQGLDGHRADRESRVAARQPAAISSKRA
jgi:hypothetical protein